MKLVNMKLPKKTKEELKADCQPISCGDEDQWPYGLRISFEKEQIAKMPEVAKLKVGDAVSVSGVGKVTLVRMLERVTGRDDHNVEVQLERVGVMSKKGLGEMDMAEYNKARNEGQGR